jgi:hypothetical protein
MEIRNSAEPPVCLDPGLYVTQHIPVNLLQATRRTRQQCSDLVLRCNALFSTIKSAVELSGGGGVVLRENTAIE